MEQIRAFIAIELSQEIKAYLTRLQDRLKGEAPSIVRWVDPEGVHLTLKFLGNIPLGKVEGITRAMSQAAQEASPFRLGLGDLGGFPNLSQPRVLWVGLEGDVAELSALQKRLDHHLASLGFSKETRPFTAHLTLGRLREGARPPERRRLGEKIASMEAEKGPALPVDSLNLMRSTLTRAGAIYHRLSLVELQPSLPTAPN